jgi:hypothetical protein
VNIPNEIVKKKRGRPPLPRDNHGKIIRETKEQRKNTQVQSKELSVGTQAAKPISTPFTNEQIHNIRTIFAKLVGVNAYADIRIRNFTLDDLERFLDDPIRYVSQLADICHHFYTIEGFFQSLIDFYVQPILYRFTVDTKAVGAGFQKITKAKNAKDKFEKNFLAFASRANQLNLGRELKRILLRMHLEDVYYGYWVEDEKSSTIIEFPSSWCKLSGKANGNWTFELLSSRISERDLDSILPKKLASTVRKHKKKNENTPIPFEDGLCFKYLDHTPFIIPPFVFALRLIVDIIKMKRLGLIQQETDTKTLISMLIPTGDDLDDIKFTNPYIKDYAEGITDVLGDGSVLLPSPMKLEVLPTAKSTAAERNSLKTGISTFGSESGKPDFSRSETASALKRAIENAQSKPFTLLDQISNVITLKLCIDGYSPEVGYGFVYRILHMNQFNVAEVQADILKQAQFGAVNKFELEAARGKNPAVLIGSHYAENVVFRNMFDSFTVLQSSHTQSGNNEGGAPKKDEDDLTDTGAQTRETDQNDPAARDI